MKIVAYILLVIAFAAFLAAIWTLNWQYAATGVLTLFTGAAILGNRTPRTPRQTAGYRGTTDDH